MLEGSLPVVGACWRGKYDILEQLTTAADTPTWRGKMVENGTEVVLRAARFEDVTLRAQAWAKQGGIDSPHLQRAREAHAAGEWRVEVAEAPRGETLRVWRSKRGAVDADTIKSIVSQIADALAALHAFELVHLDLRPDAIFVVENGPSLTCIVGGFEHLTGFDRKDPISAPVDPLYAPPEAVGLNVHPPGPSLCAWDWWTLGRVVQELILGESIAAQLARAANPPGDARSVAESLLMETDPKGPRAGAVEKMPGLDPAVRQLLRGLLTTVQDGRWTGDNVDRWIRGLPVKEHYDTPRKDVHFRWRGRAYTVPEIAAVLQSAEHWSESNVQLFEQTTPGTLAHFLRWSPTQSTAVEQLVSALELADMLPLKLSTPLAQREAVIMVALLQLSAGKLVWRGQHFETQSVATMLSELGDTDAVMILRALTTRATALQVERVDPGAGRLLTELGRTVGDVESILKRYGWLTASDAQSAARIFRLAVEPIPTLRAAREELAQKFAGSDHTAMEKLFKAQNVGRSELVVLAWAAATPEKFKFYTHVEAARRRAEALRARGIELTETLSWAELERALQIGRLVLGGWGTFIATWFLCGVVLAVLWPGPLGLALAVIPGAIALVYRVSAAAAQRRELRRVLPDASWTWRDGPDRCRRELRRAGRGVRMEVLETERSNIEKELASLTQVQPPPAPVPALPRFARVRLTGALSWVLIAAFIGVSAWRFKTHPLSTKELQAAWAPAKPTDKPAAQKVAAPKTEEKDADVKVSWPFKPGERATKLSVRSTQPATSEQTTYARKHGRQIVADYRPDTITAPIILPVPAGADVAVMLFDGRNGELLNEQVYLLDFAPMARDWVELAGHRGVYLDR